MFGNQSKNEYLCTEQFLTINILKMIKKTLFSSFVLMAMTAAAQKTTITIDVNKPLHAVSPTLFGIFLEDINLS